MLTVLFCFVFFHQDLSQRFCVGKPKMLVLQWESFPQQTMEFLEAKDSARQLVASPLLVQKHGRSQAKKINQANRLSLG